MANFFGTKNKIARASKSHESAYQTEYKHPKYGNDISYAFTQSFFENITSDTFSNIKGLDETFEASLWGDQTTINPYFGLTHYILKSFVMCQKIYLKVNYERGAISDKSYIFYEEVSLHKIKKGDENSILVIDFDRSNCGWCDSYLIRCAFDLLECLLDYARVGVELANQPILKMSGLRIEDPKFQADISQQVANFSKVLREKRGIAVADAGDSLELMTVNGDQYDKFMAMIWGMIAQISRLPLSYISGNMNGTLNSTGEGDRMQIDRALKGYYNSYFSPIIARVYDIVGIEKDYYYSEDLASKIEGLGTSLAIIESSMMLSQEKKEEMINTLLEG